jgi:hypothetical protein
MATDVNQLIKREKIMFKKSDTGGFAYAQDTFAISEVIQKLTPWQERGYSYSSTGYGRKIPTSVVVKIANRYYRVYCCVFSNIGTCYIVKNKENYIIDIEVAQDQLKYWRTHV